MRPIVYICHLDNKFSTHQAKKELHIVVQGNNFSIDMPNVDISHISKLTAVCRKFSKFDIRVQILGIRGVKLEIPENVVSILCSSFGSMNLIAPFHNYIVHNTANIEYANVGVIYDTSSGAIYPNRNVTYKQKIVMRDVLRSDVSTLQYDTDDDIYEWEYIYNGKNCAEHLIVTKHTADIVLANRVETIESLHGKLFMSPVGKHPIGFFSWRVSTI
jgi:hypothetical protein